MTTPKSFKSIEAKLFLKGKEIVGIGNKIEPKSFESEEAAKSFLKANGIVGFPHRSNRLGSRGFMAVVPHQGSMWAIVSVSEMVYLGEW